ncbi:MAG: ComEC/Rec2 family competence protein [Candidatus Omnitrophota bacterium]|nr:ComEC/Rec2 family competence protein [Candidatus Omnitrophota bacterium]
MDKRPLVVIAVFFILGIVLARFLPDSITLLHAFVITLILVTLTLTLSLKRERGAHVFLFLSIISLGALLYLNSNIFPQNHISHFLGNDKIKAEITGVIKGPSESRGIYYGKVSSRYVFELESVGGFKISGLTILRIQTEKEYNYGDRILLKGTIKRPGLSNNTSRLCPSLRSGLRSKNNNVRARPKAESRTNFDYAEYLKNQNIFAIINASEKNVILLERDYKVNPVIRYAYLVREKIKNQFLEKMPFESGAFLRAILLGDRSELPKKLNESFRNSGTMHILAISGLNVALLAGAFLYLFKLLRIKREICYILTMLLLVFLMLLTGSSASVVRATVMCIVFFTGLLLGRPVDMYNSLGAAALFILIADPKDVLDIGFQLSFIAVLSMVYLTPRLMRFVKKDWNFYARKYLAEPFMISVSATLGTFPFILYYFRMATPIAVISNIFIVPLMFILMIGGMCFIAFGWVPFLGGLIAGFNNGLANTIFFLAAFFASLKYGHFNV